LFTEDSLAADLPTKVVKLATTPAEGTASGAFFIVLFVKVSVVVVRKVQDKLYRQERIESGKV
jgi:hypothetical protein